MSSKSYFATSTSLLFKTIPYLALNVAVYGVFFLATVIWMALWGGLAWAVSGFAPVLSYVFVFIGLMAGAGAIKWLRRYILYMVKGGHIATLTAMLRGTNAPSGMQQISWGKDKIQEHFKDVSMLFGLDVLIKGALKSLSRKILRFSRWLPLPDSAKSIVKIITEIMNRSLTYVDEAILSYAIYREEESVWDSARHGIILYAQSYKPILITAVKVWVAGKVFYVLSLIVVGAPIIALMFLVQNSVFHLVLVVVALFAAWALEEALFEPFAMTYVLVTYHYEIAGKVPDPEWDQRLAGVSDSFKEIVGKASPLVPESLRPSPEPQPVT